MGEVGPSFVGLGENLHRVLDSKWKKNTVPKRLLFMLKSRNIRYMYINPIPCVHIWATKASVKQLFKFFCDLQVTFMWESHLDRKKLEKSLRTFLLLFNSLKFGNTSLFCYNGYSFWWISSRITKKIIYKWKKWKKSANDFFIAVLLHF